MNGATQYGALLEAAGRRVQEPVLLEVPSKIPEMELQAAWFAGEYGRKFTAMDGRQIEIVQFGVWNREAGPDFTDAALSIDGATPVRGAIEIDTDVRDWETHGHATNPDYDSVVLHAFFRKPQERVFTRTSDHRDVVQILLDATDAAHPVDAPLAKPGRCSGPLRSATGESARGILLAAAEFRLQQKAARLARAVEIHGPDEALFQALAVTLGYKANKVPFTVLAQRLPLRVLRKSPGDIDALLFGVAGFLGESDLSKFDPGTKRYVRSLWESWWARRPEFERAILPSDAWRLSGIRPVNHPQRRLAALAQIARCWPELRALSERCDSAEIRRFFNGLHDDYWERHYTVQSGPSAKPMALVGRTRVTEMLMNVFFPFAYGNAHEIWDRYCRLPATLGNRKVETAAMRLFGDAPMRNEILKKAANQQGLLQIYEDFCMRDATDCRRCAFPEQLAQFSR